MTANILYRGRLQRSRLSFLTESSAQAYGPVKLVWLFPNRMTNELVKHFQNFIKQNPWIEDWELVDGLTGTLPVMTARLCRVLEHRETPLVAVGLTAAPYAAFVAKGKSVWCFNSIPEEKLFHNSSLRNRLYVESLWLMTRLAARWRAPDLVVNVSEPMNDFVQKRGKFKQVFAAPLCANPKNFTPQESLPRQYMTYVGTGAPWQGMDQLAQLWGALYRLDNSLKFRVISRDERTKTLARELPQDAIEFRPAQGPEEVARFLWEAKAGFLIRVPHLLNRIAIPIKFGEYVASETVVVASDLGWEPGNIIQKTGCGVLVHPTQEPEAAAQTVLTFCNNAVSQFDPAERCRMATDLLDRQKWVEKLAAALPK